MASRNARGAASPAFFLWFTNGFILLPFAFRRRAPGGLFWFVDLLVQVATSCSFSFRFWLRRNQRQSRLFSNGSTLQGFIVSASNRLSLLPTSLPLMASRSSFDP